MKFKPFKGSDFVDGEMDYETNTCILTEKGPPSGGPPGGDGGGGGPPGEKRLIKRKPFMGYRG